jgi:AcrR family transcriptional regulator
MVANATRARPITRRRARLTRDRILRTALRLADRHGIEAASMRRLGQALRVEPMSLYKHVADKEDVLDGLAELVMAEVELAPAGMDWRSWVRQTATSFRAVLVRHPWAPPILESRSSPGPARLRFLDGMIGALRGAGFPLPVVGQACLAIDSHIYGFTLQESSWTFEPDAGPEEAAATAGRMGDDYPNLRDIAQEAATKPASFQVDFEFGLDLLLDGLDRLRGLEADGQR